MIIGMFHARRISRFFFSPSLLFPYSFSFLLLRSSFRLVPVGVTGGSNSKNHYDLIPSVNNPSPSYISQSRCPTRQSLFKSPLAVSFRFVRSSRLAIILYRPNSFGFLSSCRRHSCLLSLINLNEKERKRVKDATILCAVLSNEPRRSVRFLLFSSVPRIADFAAGMQRRRNRGKIYIDVRCTLRSFLSPDNIRLYFFFSFSFAFSCTRLFSSFIVSRSFSSAVSFVHGENILCLN